MWNSFFSIFLILFTSIFLIDAFLWFYTWQSRIKIGKFVNDEDWQKKVLNKSILWLQKTPTIKVTDNNRLIIIDILKGNYKKNTIQSWQEAALLMGISEQYSKTKNTELQKQMDRFIENKINSSGNWKTPPKEVDSAILAYAVMLAKKENLQRYKPAFDEIYAMIKTKIGEDGTVMYRTHVKDYRFVDTVGFICPFLMNYGLQFQVKEAAELSLKQITEYLKNGFEEKSGLPFHTYQVSTGFPVGLAGWGRGLAWFVIGLVDTYKVLPEGFPEKEILKNEIVKLAKSSMKFQDDNGGFHWNMQDFGSRMDSSVTSVLAWFYKECENIEEISEISKAAKEKVLSYLKSVTRRNGAVDFSQGDTKGIGVYSQNFDILPFTQGFILKALNQ